MVFPNILIYKDEGDNLAHTISNYLISHEALSEYIMYSEKTINILPDLVVSIGRDFSTFSSVYQYFTKKIPCLFIDINLVSRDFQNLNSIRPDYIVCSNQQIKNKYIESGFCTDIIFVSGNILFDLTKNISKRITKNIKFKILFDMDWTAPENLIKKQVAFLVDVLNTYPHYQIKLNTVGSIDYKKFSRYCTWNNLRIIKEAFILNKISVVRNIEFILETIGSMDYCVLFKNELLVYATLLAKPCLLVSDTKKDLVIFGHSLITGLKRIEEVEHNLTEEQLNFYLINYLPGVFDSNNVERLEIIIKFITSIGRSLEPYKVTFLQKFINSYPQLVDPFHFLKLDMQEMVNGVKRIS